MLERESPSAASFYEWVRRLSIVVIGVGALGLSGVGGDLLRDNAALILTAGAVLWLLSVVRPTIKKKHQRTSADDSS